MIYFTKIRWKNILSTGNTFTEIQLDRSPNTLIVGQNGAGKSTILDALCFGLFGKPFRKINKPNLLNSINGSQAVVEIEFTIGQKNYKVVRGIKPNILEIYCNDELLNQNAKAGDYQDILEKNILKFNFKSFTQVVILGSASFVPFMQLSAADRRTIIEELLDIQIFSSMNKLVKEKLDGIKDEAKDNKYNMDLTAEKIKLQKQNIEEHRKHNEHEIEKKKSEISKSQSQADKLQNDISIIQRHVDVLVRQVSDEATIRSKNKKILQMESKLDSTVRKIKKEILFLDENAECPTCSQKIEKVFADEKKAEKHLKREDTEVALTVLREKLKESNEKIDKINEINISIAKHGNEISSQNATLREVNKYISKLQDEINNLVEIKGNIIDENEKLMELKAELKRFMEKHEKLINEKHYYDYAGSLLKDTGIKTRIIKQYLPIMNKLVNKYLNAMDFFVNFELNDNFEETIKSRHRDEFTYANFSEGEKQKLDISMLLTWRQVAKLKNSLHTNLLIMDEVFDSSLDTSSVEMLMSLLTDYSDDTNIFIISHREDQLFDKFRSVIKFEKVGNFSRIKK
jgi:DNA repair exonuclease SbcCD ATPase subunit